MTDVQILQRPYIQRQNLLVVPDDLVADLNEFAEAGSAETPVLKKIIKKLPGFGQGDDEDDQLPSHIAKPLQAAREFRKNGFELRFVGDEEAQSLLFDAPGHPVRDVVYVGHPLIPEKYYPTAAFHRELLEDRYCEVFTLLAHLGASRIRVEGRGVETKAGGFSLSFLGLRSGDNAASLDAKKEKSQRTVWEATLDGGPPKMPKGQLWFPYEQTWQTLAETRLNFGLKSFELTVDQKDDFGVTSSFEGVVNGLGLKLGGTYSDVSSVSLALSGEFGS